MVVGDLDVGVRNSSCQCIHFLQRDSPFGLENIQQKILTHFFFFRAIIIAWLTGKSSIEQHKIGVKQKKDSTSVSMLTSSSNLARMTAKNPTVSDTSLDPQTGSLSGRLNDNYIHYPEFSSSKQPCCSLYHLLAPNKNVQTHSYVFQCDICQVHLGI
jgi:hypothetical protein